MNLRMQRRKGVWTKGETVVVEGQCGRQIYLGRQAATEIKEGKVEGEEQR